MERSDDGGETGEALWPVDYTRGLVEASAPREPFDPLARHPRDRFETPVVVERNGACGSAVVPIGLPAVALLGRMGRSSGRTKISFETIEQIKEADRFPGAVPLSDTDLVEDPGLF